MGLAPVLGTTGIVTAIHVALGKNFPDLSGSINEAKFAQRTHTHTLDAGGAKCEHNSTLPAITKDCADETNECRTGPTDDVVIASPRRHWEEAGRERDGNWNVLTANVTFDVVQW